MQPRSQGLSLQPHPPPPEREKRVGWAGERDPGNEGLGSLVVNEFIAKNLRVEKSSKTEMNYLVGI